MSRYSSPVYQRAETECPDRRSIVPARSSEERSLQPTKSKCNNVSSQRCSISTPSIDGNRESHADSMHISLWSDVRLLILVCHCNLAYSILHNLVPFIPNPTIITSDGGSTFGFTQVLTLTFAFGDIFGTWITVVLMLKYGITRVLQASLFTTSTLASIMAFLYKNYENTYQNNAYSSLSNDNWRGITMTIGYTICGLTSSALTPAALFLVACLYQKHLQPSRLVIWGAMAIIGNIVGLICSIRGSENFNLIMVIQALYFAAFSLGIYALVEAPDLRSVDYCLRRPQRAPNQVRGKFIPFIRTLYKSQRSEVMSSLKDPQIYFFLIASVLDGFDHWSYTALSECGMSVIYGQPVLFLMYVICGLVLWKIPQLRITLLLTSLAIKLIFTWLRPPFDMGCSSQHFWFFMIAAAAGHFSIVCLVSLAAANINGSVRRALAVSVICTGYACGPLLQSAANVIIMVYYPEDDTARPMSSLWTGIMFLSVLLYAGWLRYQNRKRKRVIAELGLSDEDSVRLERVGMEAGMTDVENIHFRYQY